MLCIALRPRQKLGMIFIKKGVLKLKLQFFFNNPDSSVKKSEIFG
jgi:hypothetical protein